MATDTVKIQHGYKIRGIEPPDLKDYDQSTRKLYWSWVVELGLRRKDKELSQGLDKDGKVMTIKAATRLHRRSAMTPSGKGDPGAPPLTPAFQKSRTRSLLAGRALSTHADFFWRYDAFTGDSWAVVLSYQAEAGRDVFGLSEAGTAAVKASSWAKWARWKEGKVRQVSIPTKVAKPAAIPRQSMPQPGETKTVNKGREPTEAATYGIGAEGPRKGHGGRTQAEWDAYFRQTASAMVPGRPANPKSRSDIVGPKYNRIIRHTWNQPRQGSQGGPSLPGPGPAVPPVIAQRQSLPKQVPAPEPPIPHDFVENVLQAVRNVPAAQLQWGRRAWIADVWREYLELPGAMQLSLEAFKARIVEVYALRARMVRLDLVQAVDFAKIAPSEAQYRIGGHVAAAYHFFKVG